MRHSLRIFTAAIAALAAILGLVALTLSGGAFSARAEGGKQTADAAFSYIYGMPVSATGNGECVYLLGDDGAVLDLYPDGSVSPFGGTITLVGADSAANADVIAISESTAYLFGGSIIAAAVGSDGVYALTQDSLSLSDEQSRAKAKPETDCVFTSVASDGSVLYLTEYNEKTLKYFIYSFDGTKKSAIISGAEIGAVLSSAVFGGRLYIATDGGLYSVDVGSELPSVKAESTYGAVIALASADKPYYVTSSGKIYALGESEPVGAYSGRITAASRRGKIAYAEYAADEVTVVTASGSEKYFVPRPSAVAIGYSGTVYAASGFTVVKAESGVVIRTYDENVTDICFDSADVGCEMPFVLTESGELYSPDGNAVGSGVKLVSSFCGGILAATESAVSLYSGSDGDGGYTATELFAASGAEDMAADRAGNIFVLSGGTITKYSAGENGIYSETENKTYANATSFIINETEFGDGGFGDVIAVSSDASSPAVTASEDAGTDMLTGGAYDEAYEAFIKENFSDLTGVPVTDGGADIYVAKEDLQLYGGPVEMPQSADIKGGSFLIALTPVYQTESGTATDYIYVASEQSDGIKTGFVNVRMIEECEVAAYYDKNAKYTTYELSLYKYPTYLLNGTEIKKLEVNVKVTLLPFVEEYRDSSGRAWSYVSVGEGADELRGYIPSVYLSEKSAALAEPYYNGEIRTDGGIAAECYALNGGKYEKSGKSVADGTRVEIIGNYTKANEYTHIKYIDENGEVCECYVLTSDVIQTEAGWYQVIMFIVAAVVVVFLIVLAVVFIKRKKKID